MLVSLVAAGRIESSLVGNALPADWSQTATVVARSGLSVDYPSAWHAEAYGEQRDSLVVASFPLTGDWPTSIPHGELYIWIFTYGAFPASATSDFPRRPTHFTLSRRDYGFYGCGFKLAGYAIRFRERGIAVQAMVALGEGARTEDATMVLDGVRVRGISPSLARS